MWRFSFKLSLMSIFFLQSCASVSSFKDGENRTIHQINCYSLGIDSCYKEAHKLCPNGFVERKNENYSSGMTCQNQLGIVRCNNNSGDKIEVICK